MTRQEHNQTFNSDRKAWDTVLSSTSGYGEKSQYDSRCPYCRRGVKHDWSKHDREISLSGE